MQQLKGKLDDRIQLDLVRLYQEKGVCGDMSPVSPKDIIARKLERFGALSPKGSVRVGSIYEDGIIQIDSDVRNAWLPGVNTGSLSNLPAPTLVQKPSLRRIVRENPNVKLQS